jgi:hypothetical protein
VLAKSEPLDLHPTVKDGIDGHHPAPLALSIHHFTVAFPPLAFMEALAARSSVLAPPAAAGDASPSPSRIRVSVALPGPRRSPSTLAISSRWQRASPRRGGGRLLAGSEESVSPDPAGDASGQAEDSLLLEVLADVLSGNFPVRFCA